jgi:hypothetical protein
VAVTDWFEFMVNLQSPVPLHGPDHPAKYAPLFGVAFSDTTVPAGNAALQVAPHVTPAGVLVTVPVEVPASCTVSWYVVAAALVIENKAKRVHTSAIAGIFFRNTEYPFLGVIKKLGQLLVMG